MTEVSGDRVMELIAVMDKLRSPGGCPWDAEQTHQSLVEFLVEETYETVEAIDSGDEVALREELGDLLLQVVFHSRLGEEADQPWNIDDVAGGITDKLIHRHPHVFGDAADDSVDAAWVDDQWQARKAKEKGRTSVTEGVPMAMPPVALAAKLINRAARGKLEIEAAPAPALAAARAAAGINSSDPSVRSDQLGDAMLALIAVAAEQHIDADAALRAAVNRLRTRIIAAETT